MRQKKANLFKNLKPHNGCMNDTNENSISISRETEIVIN